MTILPRLAMRDEPLHLLVDSTGLKMYGEGEWLAQHHGPNLFHANLSGANLINAHLNDANLG